MSYDCYCDYDAAPEFYRVTEPTARKHHKCGECGRAIQAGEKYEYTSGKWDGDMCFHKTCSRCKALRTHLQAHVRCFCWYFGSMLQDARDAIDNLPSEACGSGLLFELGRMAVAIKRAPRLEALQ